MDVEITQTGYRFAAVLDMGDGTTQEWIFQAKPVSSRWVSTHQGVDQSPESVEESVKIAFEYISCNGDRLENPFDAPNELLLEVMELHPSFRAARGDRITKRGGVA